MFPKVNGNALLVALFVIIIVSSLAAAMTKVLVVTQETVSVEVVGFRALMAANVGVEVGLQQLFPLTAAPASSCSGFPLQINSISRVDGLQTCQASVSCQLSTVGDTLLFRLESSSLCNAGALDTSRVIVVEARHRL